MIVAEMFDGEVDKCCLLGSTDLGREIASEITKTHSNFGLLVDLGHLPLLRESPQQALTIAKEFLVGAHLGNAVMDRTCAGYGDNHPIFGSPGSANDVQEMVQFLRALLDIGFLGGDPRPIVSFEIKPLKGQDSLAIIANAKRVMNQAWAMV